MSTDEAAAAGHPRSFNQLSPPQQRGSLLRFLLQFHNVLIYVLLVSAAITATLGHAVMPLSLSASWRSTPSSVSCRKEG
ncbi:MAG: hypothetical protein IPL59_26710 [Candidatus Competibacteraceae bacterium]|nr:hypothetical protein [Candidatus Competibacteraceae bacterium]